MEEPSSSYLIRPVTNDDWPQLESLWRSLYEHQRAHGMLLELPPDAFQLWMASLQPVLDRFGFVFVAEEAEALVGFLAGRIRSLPAYFGGQQVGFISEVFVPDSRRNRGIAHELLSMAHTWFRERNIARLELQVVINNSHARNFYLRRGWVEELTQMVWQEELKD